MMSVLLIIILVIIALISLLFSFNLIVLPFARGVPYVTMKRRDIRKLISSASISQEAKIVDLGSGDGRVLRFFEKSGYKNVYGYEINLWAFVICKIKNFFSRSKSKVYLKNFEKIDLGQYDVIFIYLLNNYLLRLKGKFEKELKPGTKIISYGFEIPGWQLDKIIHTRKNKRTGQIFIYEI